MATSSDESTCSDWTPTKQIEFPPSSATLGLGHCHVRFASFVRNTGIKMSAKINTAIHPGLRGDCIKCCCCLLTWLLIGVRGLWWRRQHQMPIVNPQVRVSYKHLACSVTSQSLKGHFTEDPPWQYFIPTWGVNSLAHAALSSFTVQIYFALFGITQNNI